MIHYFKLKGKTFLVLEETSKSELVDIRRFKICSVSHFHSLCGRWLLYYTQRDMFTIFSYRETDKTFILIAKPNPHLDFPTK